LSQLGWDFSTEPEFQEKLDWAEAYVREQVFLLESIRHELSLDQIDAVTGSLRPAVRDQGLWAAHLPPELGGSGYGQVKLGLLHEVLGMSPLAPAVFGAQAPDSGNSEILALAGSREQKDRYLLPLLAGELRSAFSMTEPETAGSDPTLLRTRARRRGAEWVIDGHKWFTTNGSRADFLIVMAVTDPDAEPHRRASMFIVDVDTPGVEVVRDVPTLEQPQLNEGQYASHLPSEIRYESVRVPADALLGETGDGFKIAQLRLGPGRIHHCMRWLGVCKRALEMLCERAVSRESHGGRLAEKQTIQNWIADSAAEIEAARLMTLRAAWKIDTEGSKSARREIAMIKYHGARILHDVVDRSLQAHGALGYSTDMPLEQMYREARAARIYDGPDEVHRQSVARQILRGKEQAADGVPTEFLPARRVLARARFSDLLQAASD
jgi:acyl-CoA dehydrogenase